MSLAGSDQRTGYVGITSSLPLNDAVPDSLYCYAVAALSAWSLFYRKTESGFQSVSSRWCLVYDYARPLNVIS